MKVFFSPTWAPIITTMSNFSIFIPFSILLFYFFIIYITSTFSKQFSAPNLVWNSLKTAPSQIGAVSSQVSPKISPPPPKILFPFYNGQKFTNKILHIKIILFSNNFFAILSIPYRQMISPTSSKKRKAPSKSKSASSDKKFNFIYSIAGSKSGLVHQFKS